MEKDSIPELESQLRDGIVAPPTELMPLDLLREPLPNAGPSVLEAFLREREVGR